MLDSIERLLAILSQNTPLAIVLIILVMIVLVLVSFQRTSQSSSTNSTTSTVQNNKLTLPVALVLFGSLCVLAFALYATTWNSNNQTAIVVVTATPQALNVTPTSEPATPQALSATPTSEPATPQPLVATSNPTPTPSATLAPPSPTPRLVDTPEPPPPPTTPPAPTPTIPIEDSSYRYGNGEWSSWYTVFTTNGAEARTAPAGDDLCIDVLNPGHDIWDIEVGPNKLLLASNRSYTLRVTVRSTNNRIARVHVKYEPGVDIVLDRADSMVIGPDPSTHEFGFNVEGSQSMTAIFVSVLVGGKDRGQGTVCLSSVVIEPR